MQVDSISFKNHLFKLAAKLTNSNSDLTTAHTIIFKYTSLNILQACRTLTRQYFIAYNKQCGSRILLFMSPVYDKRWKNMILCFVEFRSPANLASSCRANVKKRIKMKHQFCWFCTTTHVSTFCLQDEMLFLHYFMSLYKTLRVSESLCNIYIRYLYTHQIKFAKFQKSN